MNRKLHRWISTAFMVFITWVAVTGTITAAYELIDPSSWRRSGGGPGGFGPAPAELSVALPTGAALDAAIATTLNAARRASPEAVGEIGVQLAMRDGRPVGTVTFGSGAKVQKLIFDTTNGRVLPPPPSPAPRPASAVFGGVLQSIHSFEIFGHQWIVLSIATGIVMAVLSVTGIAMYFDMWSKRRRANRKEIFWK